MAYSFLSKPLPIGTFIGILIGLILPTYLLAQTNQKNTYLTPRDGLSYGWVMDTYEDSRGFLWIGTYNGLNRYDGYEFKVFKHDKDNPESISGNIIDAIQEDIYGQIWLSITTKEGAKSCKYNKEKGTFTLLEKGKDFLFFPKSKEAYRVLNRRWLPYLPELIDLYYPDSLLTPLSLTSLENLKDPWFIAYNIQASILYPNKKLKIWLKDNSYLNYDVQQCKWTHHILEQTIDAQWSHAFLPIDSERRFWYPSLDSSCPDVFEYFRLPIDIAPTDWVYTYLDNQHHIWMKTKSDELYVYKIDIGVVQYIGNFNGNNQIFYTDKKNNSWIGHSQGLIRVSNKQQLFENYLAKPFEHEKVAPVDFSARNMLETNTGKILVHGQRGKEIYELDPKQKTSRLLPLGLKNNRHTFTNLLWSSDSLLWFNISGLGLMQYNLINQTGEVFPIPDNQAFTIADRQQRIWKDTKGMKRNVSQLGYFDIKTKTFTALKKYAGSIGAGYFQAKKDIIWAGYKEGLIKINTLTDSLSFIPLHFFKETNLFRSFSSVWSITEWQNHLWLGTGEGLLQFDPIKEKVVAHFSISEGLPDNRIYTLQASEKYLWLGTHYGLCRFDPKTLASKTYYVEDGLSHNEFNRFSSLQTKDGKLWFGGLNGVNTFHPADLKDHDNISSDLIWIGLKTYDLTNDKTVVKDLSTQKGELNLSISPYINEINVQFALLNYANSNKNKYYWYIEELEKAWSQNSHEPIAKYLNLPTGTYTLHIKAIDSKGNPAKNELSVKLTVLQIWYKQPWAYFLYSLIFLGTLMIVYNIFYKFKILEIEKNKAKESEQFKQSFLANMSHEIRTPMHAISGIIKILKRNIYLPEQTPYLNAIQQSSNNLLVILNDILDMSKIEVGKLKIEAVQANLDIIVQHVLDTLKFKAEEKGLVLTTIIEPNFPTLIITDPTRLTQILINLISNAIKFTETGKITLLFKQIITPTETLFECRVEDTGIGIAAQKLNIIFNSFEQGAKITHRKYGGTGLGLTICKQLVELQNGQIGVESELGKGSTFFFTLPLVIADTEEEAPIKITEDQLKSMGEKVGAINLLLVDDNEFNQMIAQDDLAYYFPHIHIDTAENGEVAINKWKNGQYDLILMDIEMPILNGHEAAQFIREWEKNELSSNTQIPIIAMTASLLNSEIQRCYKSGMNNYIPKPYPIEDLIGKIYEEYFKT